MNNPSPRASIFLQDFRVLTQIGVSEAERAQPQWVRFDCFVYLNCAPRACETDQYSQTLCYAQIAQIIKKVALERSYHLVEKLAADVMQALYHDFKSNIQFSIKTLDKIELKVTKLFAPVPDLMGGAGVTLVKEF